MKALLLSAAEGLSSRIAALSQILGRRVAPDPAAVLDRSDSIRLSEPGRTSANGSCRLIRAADGWMALNLPRPDDWELVPALLCRSIQAPAWSVIEDQARNIPVRQLISQATDIGLAASAVSGTRRQSVLPDLYGRARSRPKPDGRLRVIDLSSLWAGPLCAGLLAEMGADVMKIECRNRQDPTHQLPAFSARLNRAKRRILMDFRAAGTAEELLRLVTSADVLVTNARPRALDQLGLSRDRLACANPDLIHVAITAHGWHGDSGLRVGFGDDGAAAGGLLSPGPDGDPAFTGDAVADPLTGLAAAAACLQAIAGSRVGLIDATLAGTAAGVAHGLHVPGGGTA